MSQGILVGANCKQEWLLPWWWEHFSKWNTDEVAFADFGMSHQAQAWCRERGSLIPIPEAHIAGPLVLNSQLVDLWENRWKERGQKQDLWELRKVLFQKSLAMSLSPFDRTIWLDLDCEVRNSLHPLMLIELESSKLAVMQSGTILCIETVSEGETQSKELPMYNSGVIVFEKDSPLLNLWAKSTEEGSRLAKTDDELLSFLISFYRISITPLPSCYNWDILRLGLNLDAVIYHWQGEEGKNHILSNSTQKAKPFAPYKN